MVEITETEANQIKAHSGDPYLRDLLPALHYLDQMLKRALVAAPDVFGGTAARAPYRGLYIAKHEAEKLLKRGPSAPPISTNSDETGQAGLDVCVAAGQLSWRNQ